MDDALLRELYDLVKLAPQNIEKTMTAPVTVIVAHDLEFYERLPRLMPHVDARSWFATRPAEQIERAGGRGIFPDGRVRSNFLVNLGYGDGAPYPRNPRF